MARGPCISHVALQDIRAQNAAALAAERGVVELCHELGQGGIAAVRLGDRPDAPGKLVVLVDAPGRVPLYPLAWWNIMCSPSETCCP